MRNNQWVIALGLAALISFQCSASTEESVSKSLQVQSGGSLVVDVEFGSVDIKPGEPGQVRVDAWREVSRGSKKQEEAFLQDRPVQVTFEDDKVTIRAQPRNKTHWWNKRMSVKGKYTITVPSQFNARVSTAGGDVSVTGLTGNVDARTSGGALQFAEIKGDLRGSTAGGAVRVSKAEGKMHLATSGGPIQVSNGAGSLEASTAGGAIKVAGFKGSATLKTSGGSLTLENIEGAVDGSTSGGHISTVFGTQVTEAVKLSSTGGGIHVKLPVTAALDLDASALGGEVHTELPVTTVGKQSDNKIKGTINGGGKAVTLRSVGGGVRIDKL